MKINFVWIMLISIISMTACSESEGLLPEPTDDVITKSAAIKGLELCWNEEQQIIDGFGVAQAGWSADLFKYPKRDEVSALLFGANGLKINMLRGQVFPHYWENEADTTFNTNENVDMPLSDPYFTTATSEDLDRKGQLWVSKTAQLYGVDKFFFSTWSPPAWMKSNNSSIGGSLNADYYQRFAEYLAAFCKEYKQAGLNVYAISPVNEPNFEAEWNSCKWSEKELADFIANNMGPTFEREGVNSKIIFGELAQWSTLVLGAFNLVSAKKYVENVMSANPSMLNYADIAAGHGYNIPKIPYEFPIVPYDKAVENGLKVWLTEVSTTYDDFDASMDNGLYWAEVFYKYLANANVNAICWWAGARPTSNNESLIQLNDGGNYVVTKRFETYGNYTRYIKPGSIRVTMNKGLLVSSKILVSSFKKDNEFTIVAVNKGSEAVSTNMKLNGAAGNGKLKKYLTDKENRWSESEVEQDGDGTYTLTLPASSVVTFTGSVK